MAKTNKFEDILEVVIKHLGRAAGKLKRMDRRFLILSGIAIVLVIVMLSLIIHGIKTNKEVETTTAPDYSNITDVPTTDEDVEDTVVLVGAGKYKVNTGSSPYLNMRLAADKESAVVTTIPNGTQIEIMFVDDRDVTEENEFGWGYVEYNGERGWVFMQYLKK